MIVLNGEAWILVDFKCYSVLKVSSGTWETYFKIGVDV